MKGTRIHFQWSAERPQARFATAVSLHSHTLHSREPLDFLYRVAKQYMPMRWALRGSEIGFQFLKGIRLDPGRGWWTPPLGPRDAYAVEFDQIRAMGLAPIVSLTDHDDIEAPMWLRVMPGSSNIPVSVEWSVPFRNTVFHLGVHNLPPSLARAIMDRLKAFTARPLERELQSILAALDREPGTLIVFNHPLWDETGIGQEQHRLAAIALLSRYGKYLHAIELNGLRPWSENSSAVRLACDWDKPVISGGDRHMTEPNATLNLTNAESFADFAGEIRGGYSEVLVTPHYRTLHGVRMCRNVADFFRNYENHQLGWVHWTNRVFCTLGDGSTASFSQMWRRGPIPSWMHDQDSNLDLLPAIALRRNQKEFASRWSD